MTNIQIERLKVGQMEANSYLVWEGKKKEAIILDPGDDADFIIQTILTREVTPKAIIATHGHFDHTMAVLELKLAFKVPFYMHKEDEFLLERIESTAKHFINFDPGPPPEVDIYLKDKSKLSIGGIQFEAIHTPGHTPGSICLYLKRENALFVGDLVFADGYVGRTDFSYSDKTDLINSIAKIRSLPKETTLYPGHGEEFQI